MRAAAARAFEALVVTAASTGIVAVSHDVPYLLRQPYWVDEAWVAVAQVFPISDLLVVSSSTPPLWNLVQRSIVLGDQGQRLLPLGLLALAGLLAYLLGRMSGGSALRSRLIGAATALAVLLAPASLERNDLKQYTADAAFALGIVLLGVVISRRPLSYAPYVGLVAAGTVGFATSIPSAFVTVAAVIVSIVSAARSRNRRVILLALGTGAILAIALATIYLTIYAGATNEALADYWRAYYPGVLELPGFTADRAAALSHLPWLVALPLVAAGLVSCWMFGSRAMAASIGLTAVLAVLAGVAAHYPFLDTRTSYYLVVLLVASTAIGTLAAADELMKRRPGIPRALSVIPSAIVVAAVVVLAWPSLRPHSIPNEDVRSQTYYVVAHREPSDTVLVNLHGGYGYAYYGGDAGAQIVTDPALGNGFRIGYPEGSQTVIPADHDDPAAVRDALDLAADRGGRLWIVLSHFSAADRERWVDALGDVCYETVDVGPEPLLVVPDPTDRSC